MAKILLKKINQLLYYIGEIYDFLSMVGALRVENLWLGRYR